MIRTVGLDPAQEDRARRVVQDILGRDASRLVVTVVRGADGHVKVTIDDPTPRKRASLLPQMETVQAFSDLATVLTLALEERLR